MPEITFYDSDGATEIASEAWPRMFAGTTSSAKKFAFKNTDIRGWDDVVMEIAAVGDSDGDELPRIGLDVDTLPPPFNVAASAPVAGGSFTAGTYYLVVEAFNATGRTIASAEVAVTVTLNQKFTLSWDEIVGADGYRVYLSSTSGSYGASSKVGSDITPGSTVSLLVTSETTGAGQPATENTTGGTGPDYGMPPALGTTPVTVGDVARKQMVFFWQKRVAGSGMPNTGNPRLWDIAIEET